MKVIRNLVEKLYLKVFPDRKEDHKLAELYPALEAEVSALTDPRRQAIRPVVMKYKPIHLRAAHRIDWEFRDIYFKDDRFKEALEDELFAKLAPELKKLVRFEHNVEYRDCADTVYADLKIYVEEV